MKRFLFGKKNNQALEYVDRPMPTASAFNVVIKINASSLNPHDWKYHDFLKPYSKYLPLPRIAIGHDIAGTVVEVGSRVKDFKVGDDVYTMSAKVGAFGQYLSVNQWMVAPMPEGLSYTEAATVPMAGLTAHQMFLLTELKAGQSLLLIGASGGVGVHAIQLAKAIGAHVTAVCSGRNRELVLSLGADDVIDYTEQDIDTLEQSFDLVFDAVGNLNPFKCDHLIKPNGRLATTLPEFSAYACIVLSRIPFRKYLGLGHIRRTTTLLAMPIGVNLRTLANLIKQGKLKPVVDKVFEIEHIDDAIAYSKTGRARGKIALKVSHDTDE